MDDGEVKQKWTALTDRIRALTNEAHHQNPTTSESLEEKEPLVDKVEHKKSKKK